MLQISSRGPAFECYSSVIIDNSLGGDVIDALDINELTLLMETMGISINHILVLKAAFSSWKKHPKTGFEALVSAKVECKARVRLLPIIIQQDAAAKIAHNEAVAVKNHVCCSLPLFIFVLCLQ